MTNDWRGTGWHRTLVKKWAHRQQRMHPEAHPNDEFVRSHTHHWSMLPETVDLIGALTRLPSELSTAADVSRALELDRFSSVDSIGHPMRTWR